MTMNRLPGAWFYERAHCSCSCVIVTAGRKQLQRGESLLCDRHDRMVRAVRVEMATLAEQDAICQCQSEKVKEN